MATTVLAWTAEDAWRIAVVDDGSEILVGRDQGATIRFDQPTVSRRQARVACTAGRCVVENLSATNPSRRNEEPIGQPTTLIDGDRLTLGGVRVVFHDLRAGDSVSGLKCSNCGRENDSADKDCWFCGTSLVNALSSTRMRRDVVCRVIAKNGEGHDLHLGETLALRRDGQAELQKGTPAEVPSAALVQAAEGGPSVVPGGDMSITLNGESLSAERALVTGDVIRVAEAVFTVVVR